jgi:hypothetical protein
MPSLESTYRRLLFTYPGEYRREHEEEILATLVEAAEPGRCRPSLREARDLLAGGLRTRAMLATREGGRALWADGLRLGVLLLLAMRIGDFTWWIPGSIGGSPPLPLGFTGGFVPLSPLSVLSLSTWVAPVVLTLALVAVLRGGARSSLVLVLLGGLASTSLSQPHTLLDLVSPTAPLESASTVLIALAAALLVAQWSTQRARRAWPLWIAPALVAGPALCRWAFGALTSSSAIPYVTIEPALGLLVPCALLVAVALIARDPRPSIAAAVYAAASLVQTAYLPSGRLTAGWQLIPPVVMLAAGVITTAAIMPRGGRLVRG